MSEPRAYTEEEVRDLLLKQIRAMVRYWANLPDVDKATGRRITIHDRCDGVAFSILNILDGGSMGLPAFDLTAAPHEEDKQFFIENGENWFEETVISDMLHEYYLTANSQERIA
jgi:hypothetical protein